MEEIDSSPVSPNPRKRAAPDEDLLENKPLNLKGTQFMMPTPPDTDQSSNASPICNNASSAREVSPAPSSTTLSSADIISNNGLQIPTTDSTSNALAASGSAAPPKKRRKLTPTEKEEQRKEKEAKDAVKAAEKARKDAEKAAEKVRKDEERARKDEEKRIKDEAKRKKAEENEAEKRAKDLKKEEEAQKKLKKEQNQMRLGVFFQKPATPARECDTHGGDEAPFSTARGRSLSLEPFDAVADQIRRSESPCKRAAPPVTTKSTPAKPAVSDYRKYFLAFELKSHSTMPCPLVTADLESEQEAFDLELNDPSLREKYDLGLAESYASLERQFALQRQSARGLPLPNMRRLWERIHGSVEEAIDLTGENLPLNPLEALQAASRRHIEFSRDVRPAYFGTYTKIRSPGATRRLSRNPFRRTRPDTDYDYDSEAEWDENTPDEGEGEELLDEDDDEAESQADAHEMDEFLDDEDDAPKNKRKLLTGDLVPSSTGLCWEDESGCILPSIEEGSQFKAMHDMRIGVLLPGFTGQTIDPYSTAYWESEQPAAQAPSAPKTEQAVSTTNDSMPPPRAPLQTRPNSNGTLDHLFASNVEGGERPTTGLTPAQTPKTTRKPNPKPLSKEDMEEFKGFVVGSTASKADILKELKARQVSFQYSRSSCANWVSDSQSSQTIASKQRSTTTLHKLARQRLRRSGAMFRFRECLHSHLYARL